MEILKSLLFLITIIANLLKGVFKRVIKAISEYHRSESVSQTNIVDLCDGNVSRILMPLLIANIYGFADSSREVYKRVMKLLSECPSGFVTSSLGSSRLPIYFFNNKRNSRELVNLTYECTDKWVISDVCNGYIVCQHIETSNFLNPSLRFFVVNPLFYGPLPIPESTYLMDKSTTLCNVVLYFDGRWSYEFRLYVLSRGASNGLTRIKTFSSKSMEWLDFAMTLSLNGSNVVLQQTFPPTICPNLSAYRLCRVTGLWGGQTMDCLLIMMGNNKLVLRALPETFMPKKLVEINGKLHLISWNVYIIQIWTFKAGEWELHRTINFMKLEDEIIEKYSIDQERKIQCSFWYDIDVILVPFEQILIRFNREGFTVRINLTLMKVIEMYPSSPKMEQFSFCLHSPRATYLPLGTTILMKVIEMYPRSPKMEQFSFCLHSPRATYLPLGTTNDSLSYNDSEATQFLKSFYTLP